MHQTSPHNGTMITWGKGFTNPGAVGRDPAVLLEEALSRQGMQVQAGFNKNKEKKGEETKRKRKVNAVQNVSF